MNEEIARIQRTVSESKLTQQQDQEEDALDAYMSSVSETTVTTGNYRGRGLKPTFVGVGTLIQLQYYHHAGLGVDFGKLLFTLHDQFTINNEHIN